jgi:hypothetical protein
MALLYRLFLINPASAGHGRAGVGVAIKVHRFR